MKIVVFDLDETLGYFVQLGIFWDCLNRYFSKTSETHETEFLKEDFNEIINLYPEFLRPGIIDILNYLKHKKLSKCCNKLMIYTNNQGPETWAKHLIKYFEEKIKYKLFDQIIAAFKTNGKHVEICRTSHDKSYHDLIKCTKLPKNAEICFIDDIYHPKMNNKNIYYINLKPYVHNLKLEDMLDRFINSPVGKKYLNSEESFLTFMNHEYKLYNYQTLEKKEYDYDVDKILTKKILKHLHTFFDENTRTKTKKYKFHTNKTRKN